MRPTKPSPLRRAKGVNLESTLKGASSTNMEKDIHGDVGRALTMSVTGGFKWERSVIRFVF